MVRYVSLTVEITVMQFSLVLLSPGRQQDFHAQVNPRARHFKVTLMICVCPQSTAVTNLQLDSDMADITQSLPAESVLGGEEEDIQPWDTDPAGGRLGGFIPPEQDSVSASGQIASSLGINPHTLQVKIHSGDKHLHPPLRQK